MSKQGGEIAEILRHAYDAKLKPGEVEAMCWDGSEASQAAIVNWSGGAVSGWFDHEYFLEVRTRKGTMRARKGDWIIREPDPTDDRRFFVCKPGADHE